MNRQNTQDPAGSRGPTSPFALAKSHFDTAAKDTTFAEAAQKPTPSQQRAAIHGETSTSIASRQWQQTGRKTSEELAAEAKRYAPGAHRGYLLAASHFRAHEEKATEPQPAATAAETCPWTRLVSKMKWEGYTAENKAEHERLKAVDAQEAAAKARAAAPAPSSSSPSSSAIQQRTQELLARLRARPASAAAKETTTAPQPAGELSPWGRLAARIKQEGYSESCRAEHERLEGNNARKTTAKASTTGVSPAGFFNRIIADVESGKVQPPSDPMRFVRLMAMAQERKTSEAQRQASPAKSQVAGWIRTATKKQRMAGAF